MVKDLQAKEVYDLIIKDFTGLWESVTNNPDHQIGRGNFIFGFMAMNLLEFICRMCHSDSSGKSLRDFSNELKRIEGKYFTHIPKCLTVKKDHSIDLRVKKREYTLPHLDGQDHDDLLLTLIFDLIRNGVAHQYQQLVCDHKADSDLYITLDGPTHKRYINRKKRWRHLTCISEKNGDVRLILHPQILFADFKDAAERSGILDNDPVVEHLKRRYMIEAHRLINSLVKGGHDCIEALN